MIDPKPENTDSGRRRDEFMSHNKTDRYDVELIRHLIGKRKSLRILLSLFVGQGVSSSHWRLTATSP